MPGLIKPNCELTVGEIAALTRAKLRDGGPADRRIGNIAPLDSAGPSDISFLENAKYLDAFANTRAGACLITPRFVTSAPRGPALLETPHPYPAFVAVTRKLFSEMLMVETDHDMRNSADFISLDRVAKSLIRLPGVAMVQSITRPLGQGLGKVVFHQVSSSLTGR